MNAKELRRGEVLSRVKRGELKLTEAAELLEISYRQAKRLKKRYGEGGGQALVHGNVGRVSNRAKSPEVRKRVLQLVRENYSGEPHERFGPTLAAEHLQQDHDLEISVRTLRRWMLAAGLWSRRRKRKPHRSRRQRKAHFGELIQLDGSHHDWLEGRGPKGCLMNFVDDATGRALCRFSDEETTWAAADLLQAWVRQYGVPKALYATGRMSTSAGRRRAKQSKASRTRRSSGACAPSWTYASSPLRRRRRRGAWSATTARTKTA